MLKVYLYNQLIEGKNKGVTIFICFILRFIKHKTKLILSKNIELVCLKHSLVEQREDCKAI